MGAALGSETEGRRQEAGLEDGLEHQLGGGLSHPIPHPRDGERALLAWPPRLRDVDPPRWLRPVATGQQQLTQLPQHPLHPVCLHGGQGLAVDAGGALVASHLFPGVPQHVGSSDSVQEGRKLPPTVPLRGHIKRALKCTDVFRGGVGLRHALTRPLQREHHRSPGPSLAPSCVVSGVSTTTARCDSLGTALDFGCGLIPGQASAAIDLPTGAVGSPRSPGRPSLHAAPPTPERFRAAPESKARTAAFAQLTQARPARSLTGLSFDAAGFNFLTACSFAPPPFGSASRRLPEISLPGSSGGLPGPDSHRLVASPCWAVRELLKLGMRCSHLTVVRVLRRHRLGPAPRRTQRSWRSFVRQHADQTLACDFFVVDTIWMTQLYVFLFVEVGSGCVHLAGCTYNPSAEWVVQQARNLAWKLQDGALSAKFLLRGS